MKLNDDLAKVLCDLEYEVGSKCCNPNSYDGWNDVEGCDYRYPVNFPDGEGGHIKIRCNINRRNWSGEIAVIPERVQCMKYKFGSNELLIGKGLINVLNYLEKRYGIDFEKLESELREN